MNKYVYDAAVAKGDTFKRAALDGEWFFSCAVILKTVTWINVAVGRSVLSWHSINQVIDQQVEIHK